MGPTISVVAILAFPNSEQLLIETLSAQVDRDFEVIVVDHAPKDRKPFPKDWLWVKPWDIRGVPRKRDICAAFNTGVFLSKEPYVFTLADFMNIEPSSIETIKSLMSTIGGHGTISGLKIFDKWGQQEPTVTPGTLDKQIRMSIPVSVQDIEVWPRTGVLDLNGFDEGFDECGDISCFSWDMEDRLMAAGYPLYASKVLVGYHKDHPGSGSAIHIATRSPPWGPGNYYKYKYALPRTSLMDNPSFSMKALNRVDILRQITL